MYSKVLYITAYMNRINISTLYSYSYYIHLILQARDKACGGEKQGRAGPGTGSMGGKCSVCGDRATKVRPTVANYSQLLPTVCCSSATACTPPPPASRAAPSSGGRWWAASSRRSPAGRWARRGSVRSPLPTGRSAKLAGTEDDYTCKILFKFV